MKRAAVPSILIAVVLLALGVAAEAQQAKKVYRVGYLSPGTSLDAAPAIEPFARVCVRLDTSKDKTSSLSGAFQKATQHSLPGSRPSWFVSRLTAL